MKVRELIAQLQDDIDPEAEVIAPLYNDEYEVEALCAYRRNGRAFVELELR